MALRPRHRDSLDADFTNDCKSLANMSGPLDPDLLVGIYTGGAVVADEMAPFMPGADIVHIRLQRPGTAVKSSLDLGRVLRRLPRPVANVARWLEVEFREATLSRDEGGLVPAAERLAADEPLRAAVSGKARVLVVDDTIDSGRTLRTVEHAVRLLRPNAEVRTAVLASTWRRPPHAADHCLYPRTLLRLPWSLDVRR